MSKGDHQHRVQFQEEPDIVSTSTEKPDWTAEAIGNATKWLNSAKMPDALNWASS